MTNRTAPDSGAPQPQFAFFQGEVVPLEDARVSVMTHALHYGTAVFEGIRGNWNAEHETSYIFRLREHYERLHLGCRMLMLDIPYSVDDLCDITVELVEKNGNRSDVYIRPLAYKSEELVANLKLHEIASDFTLIVVPFGNYLGVEEPALLHVVLAAPRGPDDPHPDQDLGQLLEQHPGQDRGGAGRIR